jgi:hypothetical protein
MMKDTTWKRRNHFASRHNEDYVQNIAQCIMFNQSQEAPNPEREEKARTSMKRWRTNNPVKVTAHQIVSSAIRRGSLIPCPCERCGCVVNVHAHHEDYTNPLDVIWLCSLCHGARHREINDERQQKVP